MESDVFLPLAETLYFDLLVQDHSASALIQVGYGRPQTLQSGWVVIDSIF